MPPKKRLKLINNQQKITTLLAKCSGFEPKSAFDRRPSDDHVADTGGADADGLEQAEETDSTNTSDPKQPDTGAQSNTDSHSQLEPNSGDSKRKFQERWSKIWPWLVFRDNKMFCSVCTKSGMQNTFTAGCETFKTSSMKRHEETADHRGAMASDNLKSCMQVAIKNVHSEHDKALIKAMKTVYWLASENLPLSKYESLMLLEKELEVPSLDCLKNGGRIDYQSYYSATEMLDAISNVIDNDINLKLKKSPFITLFADESTDISNTKRMTITARLIDPDTAVPSGVYLCNVEYEDGSGEGLASEIIKEIKKRDIPYRKVLGFGSDGASVMTGLGKGVHGRLKEINPHILNIHCMAHRLALCTSQAASSLPILKKYQEWMTQLFYYFKSSPTRESELHKVQALLESPQLKYKEIHAVRWLSFYEALDSVYRTIDPLLTYLHNRDASKDPKAKGLLKFMASTQFIYITYMMMDVIPVVSKLCLVFQKDDLDVAKAKHGQMLRTMMKAVQFKPGGPDGMFIADVPRPQLRESEVLIQVYATAINRADTLQRKGLYPAPAGESDILGLEAVGKIKEFGPNCQQGWKIGDRVMALLSGGGNAEYVACHESLMIRVPEDMSFTQAAAIPEVWLTAFQLLHTVGQVQKTEKVLIHAGGSGVGTAAVQLAKLAGVTAIITAGSQSKIKMAKDLGAVEGFNYKEGGFGEKVLQYTNGTGVNLILDCVGGTFYEDNMQCLATEGRWVVYGLLGGGNINGDILSKLLRKRATITGTTLRARTVQYKRELIQNFMKAALPHFQSGKLKPIIDRILPFEKIAEAHEIMESNTNAGKIVLKLLDDDVARDEL